ncbi:MAG: 5'-methylthioadenosine/adenosylhomocysteine nucleosidase [Lachnospiraceae bacterium]
MKKIGIIGAMELEVEALKNKMEVKQIVEKASMKFFEGVLNGVDVVIVKSGIGKVNAGICVQILVDLFEVTHIINTGIAGSLNAQIDIGDIVISTDLLYHDMDAVAFGYDAGQVPGMDTFSFEANEHMIECAKTSCLKVNKDISFHCGRIVTGDQFVAEKDLKNRIVSIFDGKCTEMEGAAIAHASYLNQIPFVVIRAISDKADDSAQMDYPTFEKKAAANSAALVEDFIVAL